MSPHLAMTASETGLLAHVRSLFGGEKAADDGGEWILEPFLHVDPDRIYNPVTGTELRAGPKAFRQIQNLYSTGGSARGLRAGVRAALAEQGWVVENPGEQLGRSFRLRYASLEAGTVCNQACYFCPVSTDPRESHTMSMEFYEDVVRQLSAHKETIEGVSMVQYNEPTVDAQFLERLRLLHRYGLAPAVNSNGTGLTPERVDRIAETGELRFLSINLSTLNRERYKADRGHDHVDVAARNVDYMATKRLAVQAEIMVLGRGDAVHQADFREIESRWGGSEFEVKYAEVMDRAGAVDGGDKPAEPIRRLRGCDQTGSRPVEWVHVNPYGQCVVCCQDYHNHYVVGDLREESLEDVLSGEKMARLRRQAYGYEDSPEDFICRHCIYARGQ